MHGAEAVTTWQYLGTSQFWYESFQNWQSEFLAVAAIVGGSVYLRQRRRRSRSPSTRRTPRPATEDERVRRSDGWVPADGGMRKLRSALPDCRGCDLYEDAEQVVPGEGPVARPDDAGR